MKEHDIIIVGAGLTGSVLAERYANDNKKILIIEKRDHIGGNCYDYIDKETGILMNKYGAHLFHTNKESVWDYINKFDEWIRWDHKVLAFVENKFVSIPVNITTINELCKTDLKTETDVKDWLLNNQVKYDNIVNSEQMAKSKIGISLYEKLIKNYTFKQWNKYPDELDKSVLERIPIHESFDTRYFTDKYQYLPKYGYTHLINNMLKSKNITILLNTDFNDIKHLLIDKSVIYTGPIDSYFDGLDKLEYRSIKFVNKTFKNMNYFQPNSVVNYPDIKYPFTRIVEYKHFYNQESLDTIISEEYPMDNGEPYYPVPTQKNLDLYNRYKKLAESEEKNKKYFIGRLASYKYFNMDDAIDNALNFYKEHLNI